MDHDVKHWQETQAYISKINWQVLGLELNRGIDLLCQAFKIQLFRVFLEGKKSNKIKISFLKTSALNSQHQHCFKKTLHNPHYAGRQRDDFTVKFT